MIVSWGDIGDLLIFLFAVGVTVAVYLLATFFVRSFRTVSYARRSAVGVAANVLFAVVLFGVTFLFAGVYVTAPQVKEVLAGQQAASVGLQPGDVIFSIDRQRVESVGHAQRLVSRAVNRELTLGVERGTAVFDVRVTPVAREIADRFGNVKTVGTLGLAYTEGGRRYKLNNPIEAARLTAQDSYKNAMRAFGYVQDVRFLRSPSEAPGVLLGELVGLMALLSLCFAALASVVILGRLMLRA